MSESGRAPEFLAWDFALSPCCCLSSVPNSSPADKPQPNMNANAKGNTEEMSSHLFWHNPLYSGCIGKILFNAVKADSALKIRMRIWNRLFYVSSREICREWIDRTYHTRGFILAQINVCILWGYKSNLRFSSMAVQKLRQHKRASWSLFFYSLKVRWRPPISKVSIDFGYPTWNSLKVECYKKE